MRAGAPVVSTVAQDLLDGCRILDGERLTDAFGHLSARGGPADALLTPRVGPGLVAAHDDLLAVTLDGDVVEGDPALVPGEAAVHLSILCAREDVVAVCRFHGPALMAFSTLGDPLRPTIGVGLAFGAEVPLFGTALTVTTASDGDALAATLGQGSAVILRGFGAVTTGASVGEAVVRATLLERCAAAVLAARCAGEPETYDAAQAEAFLARRAVLDEQFSRSWTYLKRRWPPDARSGT